MSLFGITRIRNESKIINNTLNHVSKLVKGIIVYDDYSTDNTVEICLNHPKVTEVIKGNKWESTPQARSLAEGTLRQIAYLEAVRQGATWVYYFDADEYIDFNEIDLNADIETYYFRLFDFYITPKDIDKNYIEREYMGCEYRDIPMLFKVNPNITFRARIPYGISNKQALGGYVKHYGKAISVEQWESTCQYYINHRWNSMDIELFERWKNRIGKAIHTKSDFGTELITWQDRYDNSKIIKIG